MGLPSLRPEVLSVEVQALWELLFHHAGFAWRSSVLWIATSKRRGTKGGTQVASVDS
jgi:hypothetical protein